MAYTIIIKTNKESKFVQNSKIILEANNYIEVNQNTFIGNKMASTIVNNELKNDTIYKQDKSKCGIEIYYGSVSKV